VLLHTHYDAKLSQQVKLDLEHGASGQRVAAQGAIAFDPDVDCSAVSGSVRSASQVSSSKTATSNPRRVTVIYATQMGAAQTTATMIADVLSAAGWAVSGPLAMNRFMDRRAKLVKTRFVIAVTSTFWRGDPPDMGRPFFAWLDQPEHRRGRRKGLLAEVSYAVVGLGSSTYELYNAAAKHLDARFDQLGARRLVKPHLHDEETNGVIATELGPWLDKCLAQMNLRLEAK
jgi:sulfite reductase alpha subunit-like flavoprotein